MLENPPQDNLQRRGISSESLHLVQRLNPSFLHPRIFIPARAGWWCLSWAGHGAWRGWGGQPISSSSFSSSLEAELGLGGPENRESLPFSSWEQETRGVWSRIPVGRRNLPRKSSGCCQSRARGGTAGLEPSLGLHRSRALALPVLHGKLITEEGQAGKIGVFQADRAAGLQPRGWSGIGVGSWL